MGGFTSNRHEQVGALGVAVAVSELENGTDGELITWDSSGAPTTVSAGTSGQVLTSNGAGAEPTFQSVTSQTTLATVTVTNNEIKNLRATPKELVAAQGANTQIVPINVILKLNYGSEVLTSSSDNLQIEYDNGSGEVLFSGLNTNDELITASADSYFVKEFSNISGAGAFASSAAENKNIVLLNVGDGEYGGNASNDTTMTVKILYIVYTFS